MAAPGWYKDRADPALARWYDGDTWTAHTVVIAEQPVGVAPPPPPGWIRAERGYERESRPELAAADPAPQPEPKPEPEPEPRAAPEAAAQAAPEPPADPAPHPQPQPEPKPDAWAPPSRALEPPEDDGPPTQPVPAVPWAAPERVEPGPASHLEELVPQGRPSVFRDLPPADAPTSFRAPDFDPPDFEGPPANRFAAMPRGLRVAVVVGLVLIAVVAAMALR